MKRIPKLWLPFAAAAVMLLVPVPRAAAQASLCPHIGSSSGCSLFITINADGTASLTNTGIGPYDNSEDVLVGVQNNSGAAVANLFLSGRDIFGFDRDGLCVYVTPRCSYGPTGYEGPNTSFTVGAGQTNNGTVNFVGGLQSGGSLYFSLEGTPGTAGQLVITVPPPTTTTPEPASLVLVATGLVGVVAAARRKRSASAAI